MDVTAMVLVATRFHNSKAWAHDNAVICNKEVGMVMGWGRDGGHGCCEGEMDMD